MSATAPRCAPLELVADPGTAAGRAEDWRTETVVQQWEPEHQLIGALMWLTADAARPILDLVPDTAMWRPANRWALEIIRTLVEQARDPNPVVVLATARGRACSLAPEPDAVPTAARHHQFAVHLADAYTQTVSPLAAPTYAREVLDEAYRRAVRFHGIRMQQYAECGSDRADITAYLTTMRAELADLWRRAETAAKPAQARTQRLHATPAAAPGRPPPP